jgi:hypothetical protein
MGPGLRRDDVEAGSANSRLGTPPALQYPCNSEVLVDLGPVDAHRHQFEALARRCTGLLQPRIPF